MSTPQSPLLDYAAPKSFFDGAYRYRSWNAAVSIVVMGAFGFGFLFAWRDAAARMLAQGVYWDMIHVFAVFGALALVGAAVTLLFLLQGRERVVRITEHGITDGRRHWPWMRIARFGGTQYTGGVAITFNLRSSGHPTRILLTTPMLTREQFVELARTVKAFAAETNAHVLVTEEPQESSD